MTLIIQIIGGIMTIMIIIIIMILTIIVFNLLIRSDSLTEIGAPNPSLFALLRGG